MCDVIGNKEAREFKNISQCGEIDVGDVNRTASFLIYTVLIRGNSRSQGIGAVQKDKRDVHLRKKAANRIPGSCTTYRDVEDIEKEFVGRVRSALSSAQVNNNFDGKLSLHRTGILRLTRLQHLSVEYQIVELSVHIIRHSKA